MLTFTKKEKITSRLKISLDLLLPIDLFAILSFIDPCSFPYMNTAALHMNCFPLLLQMLLNLDSVLLSRWDQ